METKQTNHEVEDIGDFFTNISHVFVEEFEKRGLRKHTNLIIKFFTDINLSNMTILELGCGVGGLLLKFLEMGAKHTHGVDLSESMVENAKKFAELRNFNDKTSFYVGDFGALSKGILPIKEADIVIADRVLCCSPVPLEILQSMINYNPKYIVVVQPRKNYFTRSYMWFRRLRLRLREKVKDHQAKIPFVTVKEYDKLCKINSYDRVSQKFRWGWEVVIYMRS
jgi:SAM-dependent methyltransferase